MKDIIRKYKGGEETIVTVITDGDPLEEGEEIGKEIEITISKGSSWARASWLSGWGWDLHSQQGTGFVEVEEFLSEYERIKNLPPISEIEEETI